MKFLITRTSLGLAEASPTPPCEGAVLERYTEVEYRTVSSPDQLPRMVAERWYSRGTNHRLHNGRICRDFPNAEEGWFIEIDSLEQLIELQKEWGEIRIMPHFMNHDITEIEICDGL